ncbi:MAG: MFS transporter [Clostridia bacterium]
MNKIPRMWNLNFNIVVVGSFISMMGHTCATFAISLLTFDATGSVMLFALMQVASILPRIIAPMIAGTFFDRHSRRKAIPMLDYCYTIIFATVTLLLYFNSFVYWMYIVVALLLGSIDGTYMVAFDSLFPLFVTNNTARKAYSINSMLMPIASVITSPLTLLGYDSIGATNIFLGATILFALTATSELFIRVREPHLMLIRPAEQAKLPPSPKEIELFQQGVNIVDTLERHQKRNFFADFKEGIKYIFGEKGLLAITIYFFVISLCGAVQSTLILPYFRSNYELIINGITFNGMWAYLIIFGCSTIGRIVGATVQYKVKFNEGKKFNVAVFVYICTNCISIIVFHLPLYLMALTMFFEGALAVTSYNIRISSTQIYVPDQKRGRFNGAFLFFNMLGSILGQLLAGSIGDLGWSVPIIISCVFAVNLLSVFIIIIPARKHIKPIYNINI